MFGLPTAARAAAARMTAAKPATAKPAAATSPAAKPAAAKAATAHDHNARLARNAASRSPAMAARGVVAHMGGFFQSRMEAVGVAQGSRGVGGGAVLGSAGKR